MLKYNFIKHKILIYILLVLKAVKVFLFSLIKEDWIRENISKIEEAELIARYILL